MFRTILKTRFTRWVAVFLIAAITLTISNTVTPVSAYAQSVGGKDVKLNIAAIGIENLTKQDVFDEKHGMDMLLAELTDVDGIELMAQEQVMTNLQDLEPNPDVAISVGQAIGADAVIVGFISDLKFTGSEQAEVEVGISIYGVADGNLLSEAMVVGRATRLGFSGTPEQLAELAVRDGVHTAIGFVFENMNHYGVVTMVKGNEVFTNMAERDNVRNGAEIAIFRENKQIASIEVKDTSIAHSSGTIIDQKKGVSIRSGDKVRLVYTPWTTTQTQGYTKVPKKKKFNPVIVGLLAVGLIAVASRGGNKAENPTAASGEQSVASADGRVVVYSPTPFNANYIPAPPVKITDPNATDLAACMNSSTLIEPIVSPTTTAYEFYLATSPRSSTLPGSGYTLIFDMNGVDVSGVSTSKLKCATCNKDLGQWEIVDSMYDKYLPIGNHYGVKCSAAHFTPYVVIKDKRVDPCPRPSNFKAQCGDGKVTLTWDPVNCTYATGYRVYQCSSTSCPTVKGTLDGKNTASVIYDASNDVQACFAVEAISSNAGQDAERTLIACATPSANPEVCKIEAITLVSPASNALLESDHPTFIFIGSGTEDYYILTVTDALTQNVMYTASIVGEMNGQTGEQPRQTYSNNYAGVALVNQKSYRWIVEGYRNIIGRDKVSTPFYFTYVGGSTGTGCCALETSPDTIYPNNPITLQAERPTFVWKEVQCAKYYTFDLRNGSGTLIEAPEPIDVNTHTYTGSPPLVANEQYTWQVEAHNGCGLSVFGNPAHFTKVTAGTNFELPIPLWVSGGLDPVIEGDQFVSLRWYEEPATEVIGYNIYRGEDGGTLSLIDTVYKTQLSSPLPSAKCPFQFSEEAPGYCDISITNGVKYYYKIACIQSGDAVGKLSSQQPAQSPLQRAILMGPGDNVSTDVTSDTPTFMWFKINGQGINYILTLVDNDTGVVVWQPIVSTTSIVYNGPALQLGKAYRWSIKAYNDSIQSDESETHRFVKKEAAGKPDKPYFCGGTHCSPQQSSFYSTNDTNDSIKLFWEKPTGDNIVSFLVNRCTAPGVCSGPVVATVSNTACSATLTKVVCFEDPYLDRGADYYYSIIAVDRSSNKSDPPTETPEKITLLFKGPTLVSPVGDQVVYYPNPDFQWLKMNGAEQYIVQVANKNDGFGNPSKLLWSFNAGASTQATFNSDNSAAGPLKNKEPDVPGTEYSWRVCVTNSHYPLIESSNCSTRNFYKNLLPPDIVSPATSERVVNNEITFRWTKTPGADGYMVRLCKRVGTGSNCNTLPIVYQTDVSGADTISNTMSSVMLDSCNISIDPNCTCNYQGCTHDGSYYWEVRAYDSNGATSGSWANAKRALFYKVNSPAPQLVIPTAGQVVGPDPSCGLGPDFYGSPTYNYKIMFSWMTQSGSNSYQTRIESIEASDDGSATSTPHIVTVFEQDMSTNGFNTNTNCGGGGGDYVIPFSAGQRYRWNVTTQDNPYEAANAREFITGLPAPHLVAPLNNEPVMLDDDCDGNASFLCLHFKWNGGTWQTGTTGPTQEIPGVIGASSYDIEIYKNGLPVLCNRQVTIPSTTAVTNTTNTFCDLSTASVINGDTFTWRVRARDATGLTTPSGTGIPSPWTPFNQFTVLIPPVVLASPPDNSTVCDPYNDPTNIVTACTIVDCLDMYYSWSPQPHANLACYRIEISDTYDFRNLIFADNSQSPINTFPCPLKQCYQAGETEGKYIPMMNGVTYYWRVGSSVTQGTTCGSTWVYSDVWEYFKRPPMPKNLSITATTTSAALTWTAPEDCRGNISSTSQPISFPDVPPNVGGYIVYLEQQLPDPSSPPTHIIGRLSYTASNIAIGNLTADTDYYICLTTVDGSMFETHPGHISNYVCSFTHTLPEPTTP
ncbi:MAG: hypothetical protein WCX65_04800 [bacterium]